MRRNPVMLVVLALVWGASFMLIKVAVRELAPSTLILGRLGSAAVALAAVVVASLGVRGAAAAIRESWRWLVVVGLVNTAIPFWLLSWGETRIDSGLASILQAAVPIFNAVIAFGFFHESRVTGLRLAGLGIGFVGVALLVGAQPHGKALGAVAVVGMALCYAVGSLVAGRHLKGTPPLVVALASTGLSAIVSAPAGIAQAPHAMVSWRAIGAVLTLGLVGTAFAYLLFFALVQQAGASYATLVTYLVPPIALAYGAIFLGERLAPSAFGALALVLAGVALGTGAARRPRAGRAVGGVDPAPAGRPAG